MSYTCEPGNYRNYYFGLSTDVKPIENVPNSSIFYEMDTQKFYMFDAGNKRWILQTKASASNTDNSGSEP